jgi:hypothetical protein
MIGSPPGCNRTKIHYLPPSSVWKGEIAFAAELSLQSGSKKLQKIAKPRERPNLEIADPFGRVTEGEYGGGCQRRCRAARRLLSRRRRRCLLRDNSDDAASLLRPYPISVDVIV